MPEINVTHHTVLTIRLYAETFGAAERVARAMAEDDGWALVELLSVTAHGVRDASGLVEWTVAYRAEDKA